MKPASIVFALVLVLALVACNKEEQTTERGAQGPIEVHVWEGDDGRPARLRASRIAVAGEDLERYDLFDLDLHRPLDRGYLVLNADHGQLQMGFQTEDVLVDPPVRISGLLDGKPLLAVSDEASLDGADDSIVLHRLRVAWSLQRPHAAALRILGNQRFQAEGWESAAGDAGCAAVLGALPHLLPEASATAP